MNNDQINKTHQAVSLLLHADPDNINIIMRDVLALLTTKQNIKLNKIIMKKINSAHITDFEE